MACHLHLRSFVTATKPQPSLNHNLKSVPLVLTGNSAGYPDVEKTALGYDPQRGREVYASKCAVCHGPDGQGQEDLNGRVVFPPLWGPRSYNWGAGMARVNTAAGFIKANMPLGQGNSLSDQQAWDAGAFIDSRERPKDPRQKASLAENAAANHGGDSYYGKIVEGRVLGTGSQEPKH